MSSDFGSSKSYSSISESESSSSISESESSSSWECNHDGCDKCLPGTTPCVLHVTISGSTGFDGTYECRNGIGLPCEWDRYDVPAIRLFIGDMFTPSGIGILINWNTQDYGWFHKNADFVENPVGSGQYKINCMGDIPGGYSQVIALGGMDGATVSVSL